MTLLFTDDFRDAVSGDPLVYIDAGARGGVEGPWAEISDARLFVVAFEPDSEAAGRLADAANGAIHVVPKALWSRSGTAVLHLADIPSTSSIPPPNFPVLDRFAPEHCAPRKTVKTIAVDTVALDEALASIGRHADFMKIDTHGAKYEILTGARNELANHTIGAVIETWTIEIHKGQRLAGDILVAMRGYGFELFDVGVAAAWPRLSTGRLPRGEKNQIVGLDLLFLKEPSALGEQPSFAKCAKAAAIADLYGFPDLAVEYLDRAAGPAADRLREVIIESLKPTRGTAFRLPSSLHRLVRSIFPARLYRHLILKPENRRGAALHYFGR